jgi:glycine cleavage system H protein
MSELKYTEEHEWLRLDEDGNVTIGISEYAQEQLGDVVYVELPELNQVIHTGEDVSVIESVKAAGEIKAPLDGTVVRINELLTEQPEIVNSDPLGDGWFFRVKPDNADDLEKYMDEDDYLEFIKDL